MWPTLADYSCLPALIAIAWVLDLMLGDPAWFPHPVRLIGLAITSLEKALRWTRMPLRLAGVILALVVPAGTYALVALALVQSAKLHPHAPKVVSVAVLYFCFATRGLAAEAKKIERLLRDGDLPAARQALRMIVSRDTESLDEAEVSRAVVETVAENSADGVLTPLIYAFVGGPALAMAYKAVSTLDSMVGYKDERYKDFGWASARLDDLASLIPARLCMLLVPAAALATGQRALEALRMGWRDGRKHPSPNAGLPEAAFAGALGVQLGGPSTYRGMPSEKPRLGDPVAPVSADTIAAAVRLLCALSTLALATGSSLLTLVVCTVAPT